MAQTATVTYASQGAASITASCEGINSAPVGVSVVVPAPGTGTYPNLNPNWGLSPLYQYDGNGNPSTGMVLGTGSFFAWSAGSGTWPTNIADAAIDPSQVYNVNYPVGLQPGTAPCGMWMWQNNSFVPVNEFYEAVWLRMPGADFEGPGTGEWKINGYWAVGSPSGQKDNDLYTVAAPAVQTGSTAAGPVCSQWRYDIRMQNVNSWSVVPNVGTQNLICGKSMRIEMHCINNTPGANNGLLDVWITNLTDGLAPVHTHHYTDRPYCTVANPAGFWRKTHVPVWGGGGTVNKTRSDNVQWARFAGFGK